MLMHVAGCICMLLHVGIDIPRVPSVYIVFQTRPRFLHVVLMATNLPNN